MRRKENVNVDETERGTSIVPIPILERMKIIITNKKPRKAKEELAIEMPVLLLKPVSSTSVVVAPKSASITIVAPIEITNPPKMFKKTLAPVVGT
tara:strand:- start:214 stop:498 length:285 start_codon:yes stop_codon:yes gene_type:complete